MAKTPAGSERASKAGWKTSTVQELLELSDEDMALIDVKLAEKQLAHAKAVPHEKARRQVLKKLARRLGT